MSFRQYGGINYAARNNIVRNNYSNANILSVMTKVGQPASYINFESDISGNTRFYGNLDISGNLFVSGNIFLKENLFVDGNIILNENLNVIGNTSLNGDLSVGGDTALNGDLDIIGNTTAYKINLTGDINTYQDATSVVPKSYVDGISAGIHPTVACQLATAETSLPITLLSGILTIDGVQTATGNRVLVNNQGYISGTNNAAVANGIYVASDTGAWSRAADCSGNNVQGQSTFVQLGNTNSKKTFIQTASGINPAFAGTDPLLYVVYNQLNLQLGQGLEFVNSSTLQMKSNLSTSPFITSLAVTGNPGTLTVSGATTLSSTLNVTGATTLSSTLNMNSDINFNGITNERQILFSGNTDQGYMKFHSTSDNDSYLEIGTTDDIVPIYFTIDANASPPPNFGIMTLNTNGLTINYPRTTVPANYALDVSGNMRITGTTTLNAGLTVNGAINLTAGLTVSGATTLSSTLNVTGATTLSSTLNVTGATTLSNQLTVSSTSVSTYQGGFIYNNQTAEGTLLSSKGTVTEIKMNNGATYHFTISNNGSSFNINDTSVNEAPYTPGDSLMCIKPYSTGGNVGIGTTNPSKKLDVVGDALINGLTVGKGGGQLVSATAIGFEALQNNTNTNNTAVGSSALKLNNSGYDNTAIGYSSLTSNIVGKFNTAVGSQSLLNNIYDANTAVGALALQTNTSGGGNVSIGYEALYANTSGSYNVSSGYQSLSSNTSGIRNVAVGTSSLGNNITGSYNTGLGDSSGANSGGNISNNTFLGHFSGVQNSATVYTNSTALGAYSTITASNQVVLGGTGTTEVKIPFGGLSISNTDTSKNSLYLTSGQLGTSAGNNSLISSYFTSVQGNSTYIDMYAYRYAAGTGWNTTASTIIQSKIDITLQAMIEFNPQNYAGGIAITNSSRNGIKINQSGLTTLTAGLTVSGATTLTGTSTAVTPSTGTNDTQIATTAFVQSAITNALPIGSIIMWNGSTAPTNWRLCNGTNGTPDLSDKFVLGYGPKAIGTVGGAATVTLSLAEIPAHSHTAQDVGHSHPVSAPTGQSEAGGGSQDTARPSTGTNTSQGYANIQIGQSGQSGAHNNMPPYYVLAFIMRYQ